MNNEKRPASASHQMKEQHKDDKVFPYFQLFFNVLTRGTTIVSGNRTLISRKSGWMKVASGSYRKCKFIEARIKRGHVSNYYRKFKST